MVLMMMVRVRRKLGIILRGDDWVRLLVRMTRWTVEVDLRLVGLCGRQPLPGEVLLEACIRGFLARVRVDRAAPAPGRGAGVRRRRTPLSRNLSGMLRSQVVLVVGVLLGCELLGLDGGERVVAGSVRRWAWSGALG